MRYMLCFLLLAMTAAGPAYTVKQYTVLTGVGILSRHDDTVIVLRRFVRDSAAGYLAVNPKSLSTAVIDSGDLVFAEASWQLLYRRFAATSSITNPLSLTPRRESGFSQPCRAITLPFLRVKDNSVSSVFATH